MQKEMGPEIVDVLLANHQKFLSFLEKRLGSRELAEEILQASMLKGLERKETLQQETKVIAWFYRLLRNTIIDYYRSQEAKARALQKLALEIDESAQQAEMEQLICTCVSTLIPTLKPEYA